MMTSLTFPTPLSIPSIITLNTLLS
jgi:hypothetical protein